MTSNCTAVTGLTFSKAGVTINHRNISDASLAGADYYIATILEIFARRHLVEDAYQSYCASRTLLSSTISTGLELDRDAGERLTRCNAMLLIRDKVLVCPSESLPAAYQLAVDESFSAPDSQASVKSMMSAYNIVDLTIMSCDGQSVASAMIARYCSGSAEYPELTFEQFTDVVERLFMKGLLTVSTGAINFGDFKRLTPICFEFGSTRGTPIDRYYLNRFVEKIHLDVVGDALEIGGNRRNRRLYNFMRTNSYRAMDLNKRLGVDIVGDAHNAKIVEHGSLDSIIIFNVLEHCEKPWIVIENMYDWLRDGGKVFCMVPTAQRIHGAPSDFWRFLPNAIDSLFAKFPIRKLFIYGNPMTAIASLMGIAAEELSREELDHTNSEYPVATCILAQKHIGHSVAKL